MQCFFLLNLLFGDGFLRSKKGSFTYYVTRKGGGGLSSRYELYRANGDLYSFALRAERGGLKIRKIALRNM
jgi:hypothetical protein